MEQARNPRSTSTSLAITGMFLLAVIAAGIIIYLLTSPPRGFMTWVVGVFTYIVLFLAYASVMGAQLGKDKTERTSGAMRIILRVVVVGYVIAGILAIAIYAAIPDHTKTTDLNFSLILGVITILAFLVGGGLRLRSLNLQGEMREARETRQEHLVQALTLRPVTARLRSVKWQDDDLISRSARAVKRLETIETQLAHSHGGGIGSREGGRMHANSPDFNEKMERHMMSLDLIISGLERGGPECQSHMSNLEATLAQVEGLLSYQGLE